MSPGQVLFVSFTQDVEYCAANSPVDLDIESDGFHLAFLENDLNDFVVSSDALSAVKVLGLWRTNLVSNLEVDSDDFPSCRQVFIGCKQNLSNLKIKLSLI